MKKLMSAILALLMVLSVASFAGAESEPIKLTWAMGTATWPPSTQPWCWKNSTK